MGSQGPEVYKEWLEEAPRLLWLPTPIGGQGELWQRPAVLSPYVNVKFADLPIYRMRNEHVLGMTMSIGVGAGGVGTCNLELTILDPTNFVIERSLRYAREKNQGGGYPNLMLQFGWTDGTELFGPEGDEFLKFTANAWVQTLGPMSTRWTFKGTVDMDSISRIARINRAIGLGDFSEGSIQTVLESVIRGQPVKVSLLGKPDNTIAARIGGFLNEPGDRTLAQVIEYIVTKILVSTEGGHFRFCWLNRVGDYVGSIPEGAAAASTKLPANTAAHLLIYDPAYVAAARKKSAEERNASLSADYSQFKGCEVLVTFPSPAGYVYELQMGGVTDWMSGTPPVSKTLIRPDGQLVQSVSGPALAADPIIAEGGQDNVADRSRDAGDLSGSGPPPTQGEQPAAAAAQSRAQEGTSFANQVTLRTPGEPWFIDSAKFSQIRFGIIYDKRANTRRAMIPFDPTSAESLADAIPFLRGPEGIDKALLPFFDPEQYDYAVGGVFLLNGVTHEIRAGSFTTSFQLVRDNNG